MTLRTITFDDEQWRVVPREPTEDMLLRGYSALMAWDARTGDDYGIREVFLAMLAAAPEPPAQQPVTNRDRGVWRAALTLANNICVQESDRYNGDDATQEASAINYCAQRIRDWIAPTDEQFAELLKEAGIDKGENNES